VEDDGLTFDPSSIRVTPIRPEDEYGGQRVTLLGRLGPARLRVQVDVGIGDAVVPEPEWLDYPSLLDLPRPRLRAYRQETAIAEMFHAMVVLGTRNSRMRDFFDVHALAARESFDGAVLARAIRATFERRRTPIPEESPAALLKAFTAVEGKRAQWNAFLRRNAIKNAPEDLEQVIAETSRFLSPALVALRQGHEFKARWQPGGPWL
jgi:hypothetical protein